MILIERNRLSGFLGLAYSTINGGIHRGRITEAEAITDKGLPVKGVTLESARTYWRWSDATVDELLLQHHIDIETKDSWVLRAMFRVDNPAYEVDIGYGRHQFSDPERPDDPTATIWRAGRYLAERLKEKK